MYLFSVALTACSNGQTVNSGDVVKFPNAKTNYGLQNLTLFKQTGIFTCEQKGLYMLFSSMMTSGIAAYFRWNVNSKTLSGTYIGGHPNHYASRSRMITVELDVSDTVSLKSERNKVFIHPYSCYTLIKIK
jgi:hypothetical protein